MFFHSILIFKLRPLGKVNQHTLFPLFEKECCGRREAVHVSLEHFWSFHWHLRAISGQMAAYTHVRLRILQRQEFSRRLLQDCKKNSIGIYFLTLLSLHRSMVSYSNFVFKTSNGLPINRKKTLQLIKDREVLGCQLCLHTTIIFFWKLMNLESALHWGMVVFQ